MDTLVLEMLLGTFALTPELEWPTNTAIDMYEDMLLGYGPRFRCGADYSLQIEVVK